MPELRLIVTDLDGTLIGRHDEFAVYSAYREKLDELRRAFGTQWAVSTGRSPRSFWRRFAPMSAMGLVPDFVVTHHAYISSITRFGYVPHVLWNLHIRYQLWVNHVSIRTAINRWHAMITDGVRRVHTLEKGRDRLHLRFDTEEAATLAADLLRERSKVYPQLMVFKHHMEVDLRSVPFTKGLAVSELVRHLRLQPESVLTIGNGHNDMSMLDGRVARYAGCPTNSEGEVMEAVSRAGGHIAGAPGLLRSELPEWWQPPARPADTRPGGRHRSERHIRARVKAYRIWLALGVTYMILVAFANYDLLPGSRVVMLPFRLCMAAIEKLAAALLD
jgi:hypothetical protein